MAQTPPELSFTLSMPKPSTHMFEVELRVTGLPPSETSIVLRLPVWRPGRYLVLDFADGIISFEALDDGGKPLPWKKTDKSTWRVVKGNRTEVVAKYLVYANEFALRTRGLNAEHGFVNGTAVFMYIEEYRNAPHIVTVRPFGNWRVTTGLPEVPGKSFTYRAADYDILADSPLQIGTQDNFEFSVAGKTHVISMVNLAGTNAPYNRQRLSADLARIVEEHLAIFRSLPYERYYFITHISPTSRGGTEHINSTIMGARPASFESEAGYLGYLTLCAHEFFHTWNVKAFKPKAFSPYDYSKENYSEELWIAEGATSYYDDLLMTRAGFRSPEQYIASLAGRVQNERSRPGNRRQSLAESSFDAWIKFWRNTEHAFNTQTDYYGKGAEVNLLLDLTIRHHSQGRRSLDDVMLAMYERFPSTGGGYTNSDYRHIAEEMAGISLEDFFRNFVYGTVPLPWETIFTYAGLELRADMSSHPWLGIVSADIPHISERPRITVIIEGSPAWEAGLILSDEITAVDGKPMSSQALNEYIAQKQIGDIVEISFSRMGEPLSVRCAIAANPVPRYSLVPAENATELQKKIRADWLRKRGTRTETK